MLKLPYSVTEDIINKVRSIPKDRALNMKNELQVTEPAMYKWAKESVKEEIKELKYSGVFPQSEEAVKVLSSVLLQAKIEGFLIGLMSQDREWSKRHLLDDNNSDIPYTNPVNALLDGSANTKYYEQLRKNMTTAEIDDINNWKNKALNAHKEFLLKKEMLGKANKFFKDNDLPKPSTPSSLGNVELTP